MREELTETWGFYIRSARELESFRSEFQAVEVHDTVPFGKLFRLDGHFMTSEKDEFFYHENLVHPAAVTHPAPVRALIVGGGDGGSADELFKHPSIESVTSPRSMLRSSEFRASTWPRCTAVRWTTRA
jgi:spermidine synthase